MPEELEFRCGAFYCSTCKRAFHYRTHVVVGTPDEILKCPDCGGLLWEMDSDKFMDNSEEILFVMSRLDDELREE